MDIFKLLILYSLTVLIIPVSLRLYLFSLKLSNLLHISFPLSSLAFHSHTFRLVSSAFFCFSANNLFVFLFAFD